MFRVWTVVSCLLVILLPDIDAHAVSSSSSRVSRHLLGITLDRVNPHVTPSPTPTPTPTPRPSKQFNIDVDHVHGHVTPTKPAKSTIFGKKKKRPILQKLKLDDMDMDADQVHEMIASASFNDNDDIKKAPIIEQIKENKTPKITTSPTTPPTEPPTDAPTDTPTEPSTETTTEQTDKEAAAHEEEIEEESSKKKKIRKTKRHEQEEHTTTEEEISKTEEHDISSNFPSDNTHVSNTAANLPLIQHSAIPFETIKPNDKIFEKLKLINQIKQSDEGEGEGQDKKEEKEGDKQQESKIKNKSNKQAVKGKQQEENQVKIKQTASKPKQQEKSEEQKDKISPKKESSFKQIKSFLTDPQRQAEAAKKWKWHPSKSTIKPQDASDHVEKIVASLNEEFVKHLEQEEAAGHDVSHIKTQTQLHTSRTPRSIVPDIHNDNLAHHDYIDPSKVIYAENIEAWKKPAAPPQPKITDVGAVVQEPDGTIHLKGQEPSAEGGPAGIDLGLP